MLAERVIDPSVTMSSPISGSITSARLRQSSSIRGSDSLIVG